MRPSKPELAVSEWAEDECLALLERLARRVPDDAAVCDEHGDAAGGGLRPQQPPRCGDLASPLRVVLGDNGVEKRAADGRAAEREPRRLAGPAEHAREHRPDLDLETTHALPDQPRVAAARSREVALRAAVLQIDGILVGLRLIRRRMPDDEDHAAALQLVAERRARGIRRRKRESSDQRDGGKCANRTRPHRF